MVAASSREPPHTKSLDVQVKVEGIDLDASEIEKLEGDLRFVLAAKLFEQRKLSMGKAAQLCGMNKIAFMDRLHEVNVPALNWTKEEIEEELARFR